jgi:uracil-DNA glycosylase
MQKQLEGNSLPPVDVKLEPGWKAALADQFTQPYFHSLIDFVKQEYKRYTVYPAGRQIFAAFDACPLRETKVVILGQDPYHGFGQAHGLCFSVLPGVAVPPSLRNIYLELQADVGFVPPPHGYLQHWAGQGVLLLNAVLTVRASEAGSHAGVGWETFTDAAIKAVAERNPHLVFLLWGSYAQRKAQLLPPGRHLILKAPHPSPLSAHRGFLGCRHFSQTNEWLAAHNLAPINWQLPQRVLAVD